MWHYGRLHTVSFQKPFTCPSIKNLFCLQQGSAELNPPNYWNSSKGSTNDFSIRKRRQRVRNLIDCRWIFYVNGKVVVVAVVVVVVIVVAVVAVAVVAVVVVVIAVVAVSYLSAPFQVQVGRVSTNHFSFVSVESKRLRFQVTLLGKPLLIERSTFLSGT